MCVCVVDDNSRNIREFKIVGAADIVDLSKRVYGACGVVGGDIGVVVRGT